MLASGFHAVSTLLGWAARAAWSSQFLRCNPNGLPWLVSSGCGRPLGCRRMCPKPAPLLRLQVRKALGHASYRLLQNHPCLTLLMVSPSSYCTLGSPGIRMPKPGDCRDPKCLQSLRFRQRFSDKLPYLLMASPSSCRTIGRPRIRIPKSRSRAMRSSRRHCWKSLRPKSAASGSTMLNSFATTCAGDKPL